MQEGFPVVRIALRIGEGNHQADAIAVGRFFDRIGPVLVFPVLIGGMDFLRLLGVCVAVGGVVQSQELVFEAAAAQIGVSDNHRLARAMRNGPELPHRVPGPTVSYAQNTNRVVLFAWRDALLRPQSQGERQQQQ